jgi:hypothetical protein
VDWIDDLTLQRWDELQPEQRQAVAEHLARMIPGRISLIGLERYRMGTQCHEIASYDIAGARFALIPGGPVRLGYDRGSFIPLTAIEHEWHQSLSDLGGDAIEEIPCIEDYLDSSLSPLRRLTLSPYLIEVTPWRTQPEFGLRRAQSHADVTQMVQKEGFRLPTSDEWEHACAAGSRTLWRWGNECPTDEGPREHYYFENGIVQPIPLNWQIHRQPNAFGLTIGYDPYKWEMCRESGIMRGGDGGGAWCGGAGHVASWLTLASSFVALEDGHEYFDIFVRRVLPLD